MTLELSGSVALVTGAGRGIGAAIARELAHQGSDLVLADVELAGVEAVAAGARASGRRAIAVQADAARLDQAEHCVATAVHELGRLDILVYCAGVARDAVIWKMTEEQWDTVLAVNLKGCFACCRAVAPVFRAQQGGRIVNIASINGLRGKAGLANYSASKAGVVALTRTLARELGPSGVTVNCIAPGMIKSPMTAGLSQRVLDNAIAESALGRLGEPEDVAWAVAFLCSPRSRHITGAVLTVDGGQSA